MVVTQPKFRWEDLSFDLFDMEELEEERR